MDEMRRPDPEAMLRKFGGEGSDMRRGHLKIFFGACAGVGKTYAMLQSARQKRRDGVDVLVGVVETHGRSETAALLEGLDVFPLAKTEYRGRSIAELDLEGLLSRKPGLVLVDELAHTNILGLRHKKRWQDVDELLNAGIDVYTTMNVQHLDRRIIACDYKTYQRCLNLLSDILILHSFLIPKIFNNNNLVSLIKDVVEGRLNGNIITG